MLVQLSLYSNTPQVLLEEDLLEFELSLYTLFRVLKFGTMFISPLRLNFWSQN